MNPLLPGAPCLWPQRTSGNSRFFDIFREYKKGTPGSNESNGSAEFQISCADIFNLYNTFLLTGSILVMEPGFDFKPYLKNLYEAILHRLRAADIDQEVKEKSITCMYVLDFAFVILMFPCFFFYSHSPILLF